MLLLVSVAGALEARAAVAGGADVVDAKDPHRGSLGAVPSRTLRAICDTVGRRRPTSAALGDPADPAGAALAARMARDADVSYVKMGFRGAPSSTQVRRLAAAARGAAGAGLILVAYADWKQVGAPEPACVLDAAVAVRAVGVLIDTVIKGPTLFDYLSWNGVFQWVGLVRRAGLLAAVAGSLGPRELLGAREAGADIVGVRGSACDGGRVGRVSRTRVAVLSAIVSGARPASIGAPV
ncbi:MAG TPA: (5-formylfuran-3-yl)methyl phosphate synthase [Gemmatimonadales bacterium]|nr:(5-formylfuran-3-yl)methyl phosphate synthase [Gemmatimonadales bacterium]